MITPAWLQAAALVLWGFAAGQRTVGVILGVARLLAPASGVRLSLTDRDLNRAVDLSGLAVVLIVVGFFVALGVSQGLLAACGWLPVALFPLLLTGALSDAPLRLRHLAATMRRSTHPDADRVAELGAPYLAMTLVSAGVLARPSPWFFWGLAGLVLAWLFFARPAQHAGAFAGFMLAALVAVGGGYAVSNGLQRAQLALQDWAVDILTGADSDPYQSQTRIGDLGRVKLSDRIAWRVEQTPPVVAPLLLRNGVFTRYANGIWVARRDAFEPVPAAPGGAPRRLALQGESSKGAAILPLPIDGGQIGGEAGTLQRNAYGIVRISDAPALLDVTVANLSDTAPVLPAPEADDLALPPGFDDLMHRLPELATLAQSSERERLAGVESWFATHFRYTLFLGDEQRGRRDLERFLLTDRAGHCEYFATSTVLVLRALGIPARYVTGYSVQEYSRLERRFLVRSRHAHAWAEAFVAGKWIEVDTTPSTWLAVEEDAAPFWRPLSDVMSFAWRRFGELRRDITASVHPVGAWALGGLLAALVAWLALKRGWKARKPGGARVGADDTARGASSAELRAFLALEHEFGTLGFGRRRTEPPRAWIARVGREGRSVLDDFRLAAACDVIEALYQKRYGRSIRE
ncbi:MAG: transglutaminase domain-containing protein [Rhodocyclaceae bacterium]|nr:MAG: transglutaminase domain-containing protein [Rhodocyclaceae bacterium]